MDDVPATQLRQLIQRHGATIVNEPGQCADLLEEILGDQYRREISLIEAAAEEGVPRQLVDWSRSPHPGSASEIEGRLSQERGLAPDASRWAVETWALALGIDLPRRSATGLRAALSIAAAAAFAGAAFSPWGLHFKANKIGASILWTQEASIRSSFLKSIGAVSILLGLIALLGLIPRRGWPTALAGIVGVAVFILFLITHSIRAHFAGSRLDFGVFLLLGASVLAFAAAFVGTRNRGSPPVPRIPQGTRPSGG